MTEHKGVSRRTFVRAAAAAGLAAGLAPLATPRRAHAAKTEWISITSRNGTFDGYLATPEAEGPRPGVVVIQEIFGVNAHIQDVTRRYAGAGYVGLAPDLFWPVQPRFSTGYTPADFDKGRAARAKISNDKAAEDIGAAIATLRARPEVQGRKVGVVGYCWGGLMTYLAAVRYHPDAASAYYAGGIANYLGEAKNLTKPIIFHFGDKDAGLPKAVVDKVKAAVQGKDAQVYVYAGAQHGFNCNERASYHPEAAKVAAQRTLDFFAQHLG
ncbi:MAG: dienelactone hydrolase family protein [Candidatus Lambdaproteobacteria bacterium]|nr:dienelactone hydrolase family protein [Candidatus Lambdaproteobacteria bacterium]